MARKRNEARSSISPKGVAVPATRPGLSHVKAVQHADPGRETKAVESSVQGSAEAATSPAPVPESEEIARLAYSYWEARGGQGGSPQEDWARAEQEFRKRRQTAAG
jgi:hypothetical protein